MGKINIKEQKKAIEHLNKLDEKRTEIIEQIKKDKGGFIHIEILLPDVSEEEFELWEHEEGLTKGFASINTATTGATITVAYNMLQRMINDIEEQTPEVKLHNLISQLRRNLTIDEEDLDDEP